MALACPICGTTTTGTGDPFDSPRSVEAHISAKRDEDHRGEQGKDHRDRIGPANDPTADGSGSSSADDDQPMNDQGGTSGGISNGSQTDPGGDGPSNGDPDDSTSPNGGDGPLRARDIEITFTNDMFPGDRFPDGPQTMTVRDALALAMEQPFSIHRLEERLEELEADMKTVELPCGHESFDPDKVPESQIEDGKAIVTCDTCGERRPVTL